MEHSADTSRKTFSSSIGCHDCIDNRPEFKDLLKYSEKIAVHWKKIAYSLNVPCHRIEVIDLNHAYVGQKCYAMFNTWLQTAVNPCWCHLIQALYVIGLNSVAEETKKHLKFIESSGIGKYGGNVEVVCT